MPTYNEKLMDIIKNDQHLSAVSSVDLHDMLNSKNLTADMHRFIWHECEKRLTTRQDVEKNSCESEEQQLNPREFKEGWWYPVIFRDGVVGVFRYSNGKLEDIEGCKWNPTIFKDIGEGFEVDFPSDK